MKKLLLLLVITSFSLTAQINVGKISLDFGETTSEKDGEIIIIAGEKNGNIYALARRKKIFICKLLMLLLKISSPVLDWILIKSMVVNYWLKTLLLLEISSI